MFTNLRIRSKILISFCAIILVVGGVFGYVSSITRSMSLASEDVVTNWMPSIRELGTLSQRFTLYRVRQMRMLLSKTPEEIATTEKQIAEVQQLISESEKKYAKLLTPGEETNLYGQYQNIAQDYSNYSNKILQLVSNGESDQARLMLLGAGKEKYDAVMEKLKEISEFNSINGDKQGQVVVDRSHQVAQAFVVGGVVIVVLVIAIGFVLGNMISTPIIAVQTVAEKVAKGDLKQTISVNSDDEIGQLAKAFQTMIMNLRTMMEREEKERQYLTDRSGELNDAMDALSRGNLTAQLPNEDHVVMGELFNRYNHAATNMNEAIRRVTEVVASGVSAASQISASTEELSTGSRSQLAEVTSIAAAIEQMSATVSDTTRQINNAADDAKSTREAAIKGGDVISDTISGINSIAEIVVSSSQTIQELGDSSAEIGEIVQVIEEIADQTNLLALNAAIEAARAGDQGRGFAVVADEVRKLAERTQMATKQISTTIKRIQTNTAHAVQSIHRGVSEAEKGKIAAQQSQTALHAIIDRARSLSDLISQIAAASEEQAATSQMISNNTTHVNDTIAQSSHAIEGIAMAINDLNSQMQSLQDVISGFETGSGRVATRSRPILGGNAMKQLS